MPRSSINVGADQRELLFVLANHPNDHLSHMNPNLNLQVLILLQSPLEHLRLLQHLLGHPKKPLNLIPSKHLILHLAFDLLDASGCHVGVPHCFYLLDCKAGA